LLQVTAHPRRVGDHRGFAGVGLGFTAVHPRRAVHRPPGQVDHHLPSVQQQRRQQHRAAVDEVDRPDHVVLGHPGHLGDQLEQRRLVVGDALREQLAALGVDHHAVVMTFAHVDPGPQPC
jgi:hypothetical protein